MISRTLITRTLLLVCLFVPALLYAQAPSLYGKQIFIAADASDAVKRSANELAGWLEKMTGEKFSTVSQAGKQGIFLVRIDSPTLPAVDPKGLKAKESPEAFLIYSNDADKLWIVGKSDLAIDRGVFWYLDKLGCRWLMPNEHWTIIPKRKSIAAKINSVQSPAFFNRDFFGTGGFGRPAIDPKMNIALSWETYKRQNLTGGTMALGGHCGEAFNIANKKVLTEHPEYMAEVNGKRQPVEGGNKLCYSNPGLQELFVQDRLKMLRNSLKTNPGTVAISVEPADGGGHCDCAACRKLGSISDRVFTLANVAARAVAKEFPGKCVNLYAYNEHAMVPAIPIELNVIVSLAPYAFQRTGLTPDELITAWGEKHSFLGIYSYWNIPDWSHCLPGLYYKDVPTLVRFWHKQHIKVFLAESTFCGATMSLNWYLASRLCWDPSLDEKALINEYFTKAFGDARAPMQRMYDRWGSDFMLTDHELGLCYRDLREAFTLSKDPEVRARLTDIGRYIQYLRLYYEYTSAKPASPERTANAKSLLTFMWRNYHTNVIQVFRMAQLINRDETPKGAPSRIDDVNPQKEMWKDIAPVTDEELAAMLADGAAKYTPLDFEIKRYATKSLVPLSDAPKPAAPIAGPVTLSGTMQFTVVVKEGTTKLTFKMAVQKKANARTGRFQVDNPAKETVAKVEDIPADGKWYDFVVETPKPGSYHVTADAQTYDLLVPQEVAVQQYVVSGSFAGTAKFRFAVRSLDQSEVVLKILIADRPTKTDKIVVTDPAGKVVLNTRFDANGKWSYLAIPVATTGTYTLDISDQKNTYVLLIPTDLPFVVDDSYTAIAPCGPTYFYVPKGQRNIAIYAPGAIPISITNPEGKPVIVERNERGEKLFLVDVPAGMDGKVWSFAKYKSWYAIKFLNVPNLFSFLPDTMLAPVDLVKPAPLKK